MKSFVTFFSFAPLAIGSITPNETEGSLMRLSVVVQFENGTIADYPAAFDLTSPSLAYGSFDRGAPFEATDINPITKFSFKNTSIAFQHRTHILDPKNAAADPKLFIGLSPNAEFFRHAPSVLLHPIRKSLGKVIFDPPNPQEYTVSGQMYYTNALRDDFWLIHTLFHFTDITGTTSAAVPHADEILPTFCSLDHSSPFIEVPQKVMLVIDDLFTAQGVEMMQPFPNDSAVIIRIRDEEVFDRLPHVELMIPTNDRELFMFTVFTPREYLVANVHNPGHYLLLFRPHEFYERCTLGPIVLGRSLVHFDARNRRVGFGRERRPHNYEF